MKLEKLFTEKDSKLYKVSGEEVSLDKVPSKTLSWKDVEPFDEGAYNEELLATLRDELKALEDLNSFVFIEPIINKETLSKENCSQFTAAMKHSARRLKDCVSIVGFAIPDEVIALGMDEVHEYVEELSAKHAHYVFFSHKKIDDVSCVIY